MPPEDPPPAPPATCGGNCCSSTTATVDLGAAASPAGAVPPVDEDGCADGCCAKEDAGSVEADEQNGCADGCCETASATCADDVEAPAARREPEAGCDEEDAAAPKGADDGCADACCAAPAPAPVPPSAAEDACQRGCCSGASAAAPSPVVDESEKMDEKPTCSRSACCGGTSPAKNGKKAQCCDDGCLDELALRDCDDEKCSQAGSSACEYHRKKTRSQYRASLEALGCICRALLARNIESCCNQTATLRRRRAARPSSRTSSMARQKKEASSCCSGSSKPARASGSVRAKNGSCRDACCDAKPPSVKDDSSPCQDSCCGVKPPGIESIASCQDACCGKKPPSIKSAASCQDACCGKKPGSVINVNIDRVDVERGDVENEHVVFTVHGMTCTGCETKLMRSLTVIPGVSRPQTSLLLSRAEFDLDGRLLSPDQIKARLEKETGFNFDKVANDDKELETIEVLTGGNAKAFVTRDMPDGVASASVVDKDVVSLKYDPKVLGARDLVNHSFSAPLKLAPLRPPPSIASGRKHVWIVGLQTLISALLTIPVLIMAWAPLPEHEIAYGSASLALATIIQVFIAGPFYSSALRSLIFSRVIEMDLLIVLSTTAAYVFSIVAFAYLVVGSPLSTGEFFETSTLLVTLIMVGRFLGALARQKAVESVSVLSLQPATALLSSKDGQVHEEEIDARLLQFGDVFKVVPETRIPTDGTIISGCSEVDESMITGESRPVAKEVGAAVIGGSVNGSGALLVRVSRLPGSNTVAKIAAMVDEAKMSKPKIQDLADKVAGWFVPVIVAITIVTFIAWVAVGVGKRGMGGSEAAVQAITYAIATLIVSCPCAIGLAVPMVVVMASGIAAEKGVVVKNAETLEIARKTSHIVFDKTGTLTQGKLSVTSEVYPDGPSDPALALLLGLVRGSKHPVSVAVAAHLESKGITAATVNDIQSLPGKGVEATIPASSASNPTTAPLTLRAGNTRWLDVESHPSVSPLLAPGSPSTTFVFTTNARLTAVFALTDTLRPDASPVLARLRALNIAISLVSGDDDGPVHTVANALAIPPSNVRARASPSDKQAYVQSISAHNADTVVAFVGDGTNDSPALASASIGIHVGGGGTDGTGTGTDVAAAAADAVLTGGSLRGVPTLLAISRATFSRIVLNFAWSGVYNVFAVLLAAGAFPGGVRIPPEYAGLGEVVSVVPVVLVAVGLRWVGGWE
ncbi:cu2+-exporting atpase [Diplodia corticola]|uniref:Cu2+-exporting atpase n=1 Tax=Diplodia corticola TaxID=236234 RepID=A0A1J9S6P6_9PEZI|nr:cu2+-exporting atpase [Diplodia corticola]OJD40619.1 cu2+-exporting atpase [Diplodia corticola]